MSIFTRLFGDSNKKFLDSFQGELDKIASLEEQMKVFSIEDFPKKTAELKARLLARAAGGEKGETLDDILPEAFAMVREVSRRTLGQRHFDVQLLGGMVLHKGQIAEMRTGEGKTLTATAPLYLNALLGKGAHLVTVNDYLARRDGVWMGQIYHALGLSIGIINHDTSFLYDPTYKHAEETEDKERDELGSFKVEQDFLRPVTRKEAYAADITYGTNNEYGFDYLRNNMAYSEEQMTQRGYQFAIVDEVDSILIDESRTPLIISAPDEESGELYKVFAGVVPKLVQGEDYNVDEKRKATTLTEVGIEKVESILGIEDIYTEKGIKYVHHLEQALKAQALFHRDKEYVVRNNEVIIVDEFTGRLMPGRRWSEGLHQAVEAKEGVTVQKESRTLASITFQNYFRLYAKLSGMTGTGQTSAEEFHKVYKLDVTTIPTNKPLVRADRSDMVFQSENGKYTAIARKVKECHEKGQPVLVGTISIAKNERLSELLKREGVPHQVLNAKQHEQEGAIIAQAGRLGAVTIATNMAGRGVDIILGGNPPSPEEARRVRDAGGLMVIGSERHEARRIDDQLRGRSGRQGDPGESQFYVSLEDDLMRVFGSDRIKNLMGTFGIPEDEAIENKMVSRSIETAQGKIEGFHFDARKHVLQYDDIMNKQRESVYRMRRELLLGTNEAVTDKVWDLLEHAIRNALAMHLVGRSDEWNVEEIVQNITAANILIPNLKEEFTRIKDSTTIEEGQKISEVEKFVIGKTEELFDAKNTEMGEEFARGLRYLALQTIDYLWIDHLEIMDYTRDSVRLRAYGQRDPLVEYKNEAARLFRDFNGAVGALLASNVFKVLAGDPHAGHNHTHAQVHPASNGAGPIAVQRMFSGAQENRQAGASIAPAKKPGDEIGRNDPCPCGSGKKWKKCGMINSPEHQQALMVK